MRPFFMLPKMAKSFSLIFLFKCRNPGLDRPSFALHCLDAPHGAHSETRETEEACCPSVRFLELFLHARQDGSQSESENSK